jgi:carbon storage regulator
MLMLTRKVGEKIRIGNDIELVVTKISGSRVTLGVTAPRDVRIVRSELKPLELLDHDYHDPSQEHELAFAVAQPAA